MALVTTKLLRTEQTGVIYADPADPDLTVRFRNTSAVKNLNGTPVKNYTTEIIYNDSHTITVGAANAEDALSVRLRVSGASQSAVRIRQLLLGLAAQVGTWETEKVFVGFAPTTVPAITVP